MPRTTVHGRKLIVEWHAARRKRALIAAAMVISRKCAGPGSAATPPRAKPDWLGAELGVPARTVSRVLGRRGQPRLCALDPITGAVIRSSKMTATRYGRSRPGELAHMDVKKLGRIPDGGGWRAHRRTAGRTARERATKVGYDYVHSLVDDHSLVGNVLRPAGVRPPPGPGGCRR